MERTATAPVEVRISLVVGGAALVPLFVEMVCSVVEGGSMSISVEAMISGLGLEIEWRVGGMFLGSGSDGRSEERVLWITNMMEWSPWASSWIRYIVVNPRNRAILIS